MSLRVCVGGTGSIMGHAASFLAISPSFIDWFVCKMEVMLWGVRTSRPGAWSPKQIPWSVLWQPQLFFWWVISCLPLIPWCVCVCMCTSEISCYFPSPLVTPKHKCCCLMYWRENGSLFPDCRKHTFNLLSPTIPSKSLAKCLDFLKIQHILGWMTMFDPFRYS